MNAAPTSTFSAFALEPFPTMAAGDDLAQIIAGVLQAQGISLIDGDIVVVASKIVSIADQRYVDLSAVTPSPEAVKLAARTGKSAEIVQLILDRSTDHFLATEQGPIIARHKLGYRLTSAGVDRAGTTGAWLLPADPDASARHLRDALRAATSTDLAVVIAGSDGRPDRHGATVISIGAAGVAPLRITGQAETGAKANPQIETFTDLVAAAAGLILGQRGRGVPVAVLRGLAYTRSDDGVVSMLHP